jgi:hypothetical protein
VSTAGLGDLHTCRVGASAVLGRLPSGMHAEGLCGKRSSGTIETSRGGCKEEDSGTITPASSLHAHCITKEGK